MSEPSTAEQTRPAPASDDAERARIVALIERGLADVKAGRVVPHAEVLAMIDARYPGSKK
jgi:predicted transcriptional regulator